MRPDLDERAAYGHARHDFPGYGAGSDPVRRLARGCAPRAAPIAQSVFHQVGVIGVAGTELVLDVAVVLGAGIDILDLERDWRAGRDLRPCLVGEHARENTHLVRFLPLGGVARLARP